MGETQLDYGLLPEPMFAGRPFLQIPPFPGCNVTRFSGQGPAWTIGQDDAADLVALVRQVRVGGAYWAKQPALPQSYVLARSVEALIAADALDDVESVLWARADADDRDPWHMLSSADALFADADDALLTLAAICEVPTYVRDAPGGRFELRQLDAASLLSAALANAALANPFTGQEMSPREAIELCGFWRELIDSNRDIAGAIGFAFWKRDNVAPLLWGGSKPVCFDEEPCGAEGRPFAIWRSKARAEVTQSLESYGNPLIEVEDGFLRSQGLGADCVPPLSITVDRLGAHFDPSRPSELETLLQEGVFEEEVLARARDLRSAIVTAGLGKYEAGGTRLDRPAGERRHILVPGQVEDDRSVLLGGCGLVSNLELLKRVREQAPDAWILYKPHPDVLAGHRKGSVSDQACLEFVDQIVVDQPISSLIEMVDEVHVNTSLAGFEALMRGKPATTHGVPFYAGWGLTNDLAEIPLRRSARRSLDELVAATLLIYPRYLDPITGLPCPAEVVVQRLVTGAAAQDGLVVSMRRFQGKMMRHLRELAR